jgi:hypothetical protein
MNAARTHCLDHTGTCANIEYVEAQIVTEKTDREKGDETIWTAIDAMRRMYLTTMGTFILTCLGIIGFLFGKTMHWL